MQVDLIAPARAFLHTPNPTTVRITTMAITTNSSTRVKPRLTGKTEDGFGARTPDC